ncbi:MAG TPA: hypothetical protein VIL83_03875 [Capillibacterium sp.]
MVLSLFFPAAEVGYFINGSEFTAPSKAMNFQAPQNTIQPGRNNADEDNYLTNGGQQAKLACFQNEMGKEEVNK